jgi:TP901 family phage tail tape measure protein
MAVGYGDLRIILRAEDFASTTLGRVGDSIKALGSKGELTGKQLGTIGRAMVGVGTGIAAIGAIGIDFFAKSAESAIKYSNGAAYAKTQTEGLHISLQQLIDTGLKIATEVPEPLDQMNQGLYNIFSSMNVNLPQATKLLKQFSEEGVAGQLDLNTASRATITEINAFHIPLKDVGNLMNANFEIVSKSRGTYADFAGVMGQMVPAFAAAGENVFQMGSDFAFATRNGAKAGAAASEAARAVETLNKAAFQTGLQTLGINFLDSAGKAKSLNEIITEIGQSPGWAAQVQKSGSVAKAYTDLFGQGTIQARRFFDLAIPHYKDLNKLQDDITNKKGAFQSAYNIMFHQPQSQIQLLKNNIGVLRVEMGESFLPVINKVAHAASTLMKWFENLSPGTKRIIMDILIGISVFMVLAGVMMVVVGGVLMFIGAIAAFTETIGAAILIAGGFLAALILIPVALFFIIKYHKDLMQWATDAWKAVKDGLKDAVEWFEKLSTPMKILVGIIATILSGGILPLIAGIILAIKYHKDLMQWATDAWHAIEDAAHDAMHIIDDVVHWIMIPVKAVADWFKHTWVAIMNWWHSYWPEMSQIILEVWAIITTVIKAAWEVIGPIIKGGLEAILALWQPIWDLISGVVTIAWDVITAVISIAWNLIYSILEAGLDVLLAVFRVAWNLIGAVVKIAWDYITTIIKVAWDLVEGIFDVALDLLTGHWSKAWNDMLSMVTSILNTIWNFIKQVFNTIVNLAIQLWHDLYNNLFSAGSDIINGLINGVNSVWHLITDTIGKIFGVVTGLFTDAIHWLEQAGKDIINGLVNGIKGAAHLVTDTLKGIANDAINAIKNPFAILSPSKVMHDIGLNITKGLANGINSGKNDVVKAAGDLINVASLQGTASANITASIRAGAAAGAGGQTVVQVPKGAVVLTINPATGTPSAADMQLYQDAFDKSMQKFATVLTQKINSTKAA